MTKVAPTAMMAMKALRVATLDEVGDADEIRIDQRANDEQQDQRRKGRDRRAGRHRASCAAPLPASSLAAHSHGLRHAVRRSASVFSAPAAQAATFFCSPAQVAHDLLFGHLVAFEHRRRCGPRASPATRRQRPITSGISEETTMIDRPSRASAAMKW